MTPHAFVRRWQDVELSERSSSQSHFNDICTLLGEQRPIEADPKGEWYTFEKGVVTPEGKNGFADVWKTSGRRDTSAGSTSGRASTRRSATPTRNS
jgi:hypothetical protein